MLFERYLSTLVRPKKHLGQHFLRDLSIAERTAEAVQFRNSILEIGPGTGVLTRYLLDRTEDLRAVELDAESVDYLLGEGLLNQNQIIQADFLRLNLEPLFSQEFSLVGNFPYNISSQILFKVLENRPRIPECVGMFQKEVA
ncbi:MAG TPA: 16S rRNA (adenine(1518)-N(6)/adenine(1519)-N(6))-dimethyltransferase, partial [Flavobacteriales bacterium]|nr:16S rRNA (adenine(1518)-N(6)/adenine(1519)-N(6))-dimethyltransferase [Flavobacteriales bacterium]